MKRLGLLLNEARQATESANYTSETGVQDSEFIRAFNDAQTRIQSMILNAYPNLFQRTKEISAVAQQSNYSNPLDLFMETRIEKIEYSANGDARNYYKLDYGFTDERCNSLSGAPSYYIRQSKIFISNPAPDSSSGKFRMTYQGSLPALDLRRGRILAVAIDPALRMITQLELDSSILNADNADLLTETEYLTVVNKNGLIKMKSIPFSAVDPNTGVITLDAFTYETDETIAVGDYVVAGKYATTHSELPDIAERYLLAFAEWRVQRRDSSNDSTETNQELKEMEAEIVLSYSRADSDVKAVPILDTSYLSFT